MTRVALLGLVLLSSVQPLLASPTEQDVADRLGDDLAAAAASLHRSIASQQLESVTTTNLAGDKAQLEMKLALKRLTVDLAVSSAKLACADREAARNARNRYAADTSQALNQYVQAVGRVYNEWLKTTGEANQRTQQNGAQYMQAGFAGVMNAQQRATQSMLGSEWPDRPPVIVPTLPDLSAQVDADACAIAEAERRIHRARVGYQANVADTFAACDRVVAAAVVMGDPDAMARTMNDAVAELTELACDRFGQYQAEVRSALESVLSVTTCGANL